MQKLSTTRLIFFLIVGLALVIVCGALAANIVSNQTKSTTATPAVAVPPGSTQTTPKVDLKSPPPIYAPGYDPNTKDGKPT